MMYLLLILHLQLFLVYTYYLIANYAFTFQQLQFFGSFFSKENSYMFRLIKVIIQKSYSILLKFIIKNIMCNTR